MKMKLRNFPPAGQVYLKTARYGNGNPAITMECADGSRYAGSRYAVCSVNPPSIETSGGDESTGLLPGEVAIKDWGENSGILTWLIAEGVVAAPHRMIPSGFVCIPICKLLQNPETGEAL